MERPDDPPALLRAATRALEGMRGVRLLGDWLWHEPTRSWAQRCSLRPERSEGSSVPASTDWYILAKDTYPLGRVKLYPAKEGGLPGTYPHQNHNSEGPPGRLWRDGGLCLETVAHSLGRKARDAEPQEPLERLSWHVARALSWVGAAEKGELARPGDPFELPHFPSGLEPRVVAFSEDSDGLARWLALSDEAGFAELRELPGNPTVWAVTAFLRRQGHPLIEAPWGDLLSRPAVEPILGVWLRLEAPLALPPWQAPLTWRELDRAFRDQRRNLVRLLESMARKLRTGKRHPALLGYPIPAVVGEEAKAMHWQALLLPALSMGDRWPSGFRPNQKGFWQLDRREVLRPEGRLDWQMSENWAPEQIASRGRLPPQMAGRLVAILGAGAVGSVLAELLARGGVHELVAVDEELLKGGNLVRHALTLMEVNANKAEGLVARLRSLSPHQKAMAIPAAFPELTEEQASALKRADIVFDCTGSDEVLGHMEAYPWGSEKLFCSLSLGMGARRLFGFVVRGDSFPRQTFAEMMRPWLLEAEKEFSADDLPREGIGCWHPVFPARADDVWMMTAIGLKFVLGTLQLPRDTPRLAVFEAQYEGDDFLGVRRISGEGDHA